MGATGYRSYRPALRCQTCPIPSFNDLGLPKPDINLGIGSGTHAEHTGKVMMAYEKVLMEQRPDLVVVVGDVNSTVAAAVKITYPQNSASNIQNSKLVV
jgi:hypothetical protein